jgi:hypothetical protein
MNKVLKFDGAEIIPCWIKRESRKINLVNILSERFVLQS